MVVRETPSCTTRVNEFLSLLYLWHIDQSVSHKNKHINMAKNTSNTSNRGFASMDEDKQREIAAKGGRARGGNKRGRKSANNS